MRATQFVLLSVAVAVALAQPPGFGMTRSSEPGAPCRTVDAVRC